MDNEILSLLEKLLKTNMEYYTYGLVCIKNQKLDVWVKSHIVLTLNGIFILSNDLFNENLDKSIFPKNNNDLINCFSDDIFRYEFIEQIEIYSENDILKDDIIKIDFKGEIETEDLPQELRKEINGKFSFKKELIIISESAFEIIEKISYLIQLYNLHNKNVYNNDLIINKKTFSEISNNSSFFYKEYHDKELFMKEFYQIIINNNENIPCDLQFGLKSFKTVKSEMFSVEKIINVESESIYSINNNKPTFMLEVKYILKFQEDNKNESHYFNFAKAKINIFPTKGNNYPVCDDFNYSYKTILMEVINQKIKYDKMIMNLNSSSNNEINYLNASITSISSISNHIKKINEKFENFNSFINTISRQYCLSCDYQITSFDNEKQNINSENNDVNRFFSENINTGSKTNLLNTLLEKFSYNEVDVDKSSKEIYNKNVFTLKEILNLPPFFNKELKVLFTLEFNDFNKEFPSLIKEKFKKQIHTILIDKIIEDYIYMIDSFEISNFNLDKISIPEKISPEFLKNREGQYYKGTYIDIIINSLFINCESVQWILEYSKILNLTMKINMNNISNIEKTKDIDKGIHLIENFTFTSLKLVYFIVNIVKLFTIQSFSNEILLCQKLSNQIETKYDDFFNNPIQDDELKQLENEFLSSSQNTNLNNNKISKSSSNNSMIKVEDNDIVKSRDKSNLINKIISVMEEKINKLNSLLQENNSLKGNSNSEINETYEINVQLKIWKFFSYIIEYIFSDESNTQLYSRIEYKTTVSDDDQGVKGRLRRNSNRSNISNLDLQGSTNVNKKVKVENRGNINTAKFSSDTYFLSIFGIDLQFIGNKFNKSIFYAKHDKFVKECLDNEFNSINSNDQYLASLNNFFNLFSIVIHNFDSFNENLKNKNEGEDRNIDNSKIFIAPNPYFITTIKRFVLKILNLQFFSKEKDGKITENHNIMSMKINYIKSIYDKISFIHFNENIMQNLIMNNTLQSVLEFTEEENLYILIERILSLNPSQKFIYGLMYNFIYLHNLGVFNLNQKKLELIEKQILDPLLKIIQSEKYLNNINLNISALLYINTVIRLSNELKLFLYKKKILDIISRLVSSSLYINENIRLLIHHIFEENISLIKDNFNSFIESQECNIIFNSLFKGILTTEKLNFKEINKGIDFREFDYKRYLKLKKNIKKSEDDESFDKEEEEENFEKRLIDFNSLYMKVGTNGIDFRKNTYFNLSIIVYKIFSFKPSLVRTFLTNNLPNSTNIIMTSIMNLDIDINHYCKFMIKKFMNLTQKKDEIKDKENEKNKSNILSGIFGGEEEQKLKYKVSLVFENNLKLEKMSKQFTSLNKILQIQILSPETILSTYIYVLKKKMELYLLLNGITNNNYDLKSQIVNKKFTYDFFTNEINFIHDILVILVISYRNPIKKVILKNDQVKDNKKNINSNEGNKEGNKIDSALLTEQNINLVVQYIETVINTIDDILSSGSFSFDDEEVKNIDSNIKNHSQSENYTLKKSNMSLDIFDLKEEIKVNQLKCYKTFQTGMVINGKYVKNTLYKLSNIINNLIRRIMSKAFDIEELNILVLESFEKFIKVIDNNTN